MVLLAIASRYFYLYTRNPIRVVELFFWPFVDLLVWGFLTLYLTSAEGHALPNTVLYLIGAVILWDALFRSQQGVAISFLEDIWTRNLLNIFAAPVRMSEYLGAMFLVGLARVILTSVILAAVAWVAFAFNLFNLNWSLVPFYANLLLFGWTLGLVSMTLILRFGHGAESLAWAVPFMIQPLVCVFYPVAALPAWLHPIALSIPATHVFEGMRGVLAHQGLNWPGLAAACGLNLLYAGGAMLMFSKTLAGAREKGFLVKVTSS